MHRQQVQTGDVSRDLTAEELAGGSGANLTDMVGLLTDGSAMRDLDMNVRRDGYS
jgi:hypothetical protein